MVGMLLTMVAIIYAALTRQLVWIDSKSHQSRRLNEWPPLPGPINRAPGFILLTVYLSLALLEIAVFGFPPTTRSDLAAHRSGVATLLLMVFVYFATSMTTAICRQIAATSPRHVWSDSTKSAADLHDPRCRTHLTGVLNSSSIPCTLVSRVRVSGIGLSVAIVNHNRLAKADGYFSSARVCSDKVHPGHLPQTCQGSPRSVPRSDAPQHSCLGNCRAESPETADSCHTMLHQWNEQNDHVPSSIDHSRVPVERRSRLVADHAS